MVLSPAPSESPSRHARWFETEAQRARRRARQAELARARRGRWIRLGVAEAVAIGVAGASYAFGQGAVTPGVLWPGVFLFVLVSGVALARLARSPLPRSAPEDAELLAPFPERDTAWLVDVLVRQGDAVTGRDRGVAWFETGHLVFSGHATSFRLARGDVAREVHRPSPGLRLAHTLRLETHTSLGRLELSLEAVDDPETQLPPDIGLTRCLREWLSVAPEDGPVGEAGQFPPVDLGPGALTPREADRALGFEVGALAAMSITVAAALDFVVLRGGLGPWWQWGPVVAGLLCLLQPRTWDLVRASRAARQAHAPLMR